MQPIHNLVVLLKELRQRANEVSLGRIDLFEHEEHQLRTAVSSGFEHGLSRLSASDRKRWGSAALLLAVKALRSADEGPFSYDRIRAYLPQWPSSLSAMEYDALEDGARLWDIEIMRAVGASGSHRRFLCTMIRHSGAGWVLLEKLAALVARQDRWDWLANTEVGLIVAWIHVYAQRTLGEQVARALEEETIEALAARLQDLAAVRTTLGEHTNPDDALKTFGANDLAHALDAPTEHATRRMLEHLCSSPDDKTCEIPRWRWQSDKEGYEQVVIEIPPRIKAPEKLPAHIDQIILKLIDDYEPRPAVYLRLEERDGRRDTFAHREGPRMRIPRSLHAQVIAQYRENCRIEEILVRDLTVRTNPIAVFDTVHSRMHAHPRPGTRIALVLAPGWKLLASKHLKPGPQKPLKAWIGTMPEHNLEYHLLGPDGVLSHTLFATRPPLQLNLTNAIEGLRLEGAPVVFGTPEFRSNIIRGKGTCTLRNGNRHLGTLQVFVRGGRLKLSSTSKPAPRWPIGAFTLDFEINGHKHHEQVATLPASTRADVVSDHNGTTATLSPPGLTAKMHILGANLRAQEGDGSLTLSPEVRGRIVINFSLPGVTSLGTWRIFAHPHTTEVIDIDGSVRDDQDDLSALRSGGGLRVYGTPRSNVRLKIKDDRWSLLLSPDGERVFPFSEIPPLLLRQEVEQKQVDRLSIRIDWPNGPPQRRDFLIHENKKPQALLVPGDGDALPRVRLAWDLCVPGEVRIEAIRAWKPWSSSIHLSAQAASWPDWDDKVGYEAEFPLEPGSYQLALFSGARRLSGVTLVRCPGIDFPPAPSYLSSLEAHLWDGPSMRELGPLVHQWSLAGEDEAGIHPLLTNVTRFGVGWFRIAEVLPEITGIWRLLSLLRDEPDELDSLIAAYYEQAGIAWMFIREHDLARAADRLSRDAPGSANTLLLRVSELDAGLLQPGARVCQDRGLIATHGHHLKSACDLKRRLDTYQRPQGLTPDERAQIINLDANEICSPRVRGLQQLRRNADEFEKHNWSIYIREEPVTPISEIWFDRHPERLGQLEHAVATFAWRVHGWRKGGVMKFNAMRELSRVEPLARKSFDYWLNYWDSHTAETGDPR